MATKQQIITIQTAKRWLEKNRGFTDAAYRMVLRSVARVESSTALGNDGFEKVMAVLEAHGFQQHRDGPDYWRKKAERGGERAVWKVEAMCAEYGVDCAGFVRRMTNGQTDRIEDCDGRALWVIIEALKKMCGRSKPDALHVPGRPDDSAAPAGDAVRSGADLRSAAGRPPQVRGLFEDGDGAGDRREGESVRGHAKAPAAKSATEERIYAEVNDDIPF